MKQMIQKQLPAGFSPTGFLLEPIFLAPFRWLVIVPMNDCYAYCYQTLWWQSCWHYQEKGNQEFRALCQQHELMQWVLRTFAMPLYHRHNKMGEDYLIVEDLKWRTEPGLGPLAFTLKFEQHNDQWQIIEARQAGFFQRGNTALFQPPALLKLNATELPGQAKFGGGQLE